MSKQNRVQAGVPAGGQFAAGSKSESTDSLAAPEQPPFPATDMRGKPIGDDPQWAPSGDHFFTVANMDTGGPHSPRVVRIYGSYPHGAQIGTEYFLNALSQQPDNPGRMDVWENDWHLDETDSAALVAYAKQHADS